MTFHLEFSRNLFKVICRRTKFGIDCMTDGKVAGVHSVTNVENEFTDSTSILVLLLYLIVAVLHEETGMVNTTVHGT